MATKKLSTDELAAAFLESLAEDAARVDELDCLYNVKYQRGSLGLAPLIDAGRVVIKEIKRLTRNPHEDFSTTDPKATFAEGREATERRIAALEQKS